MQKNIEDTLSKVTLGEKVVPFARLHYTGKSPLYIVYSILTELPEVCSDDTPETSVVTIDIDIYAKVLQNLIETVKSVKIRFIEAGWTWIDDSPEIFENETGFIHRTITFEKERMINSWQQSV